MNDDLQEMISIKKAELREVLIKALEATRSRIDRLNGQLDDLLEEETDLEQQIRLLVE